VKAPVKKAKKKLDFPYAIRSFIGYLEGTEKSLHTIKNYRLDLLAFQDFLQTGLGSKPKPLEQVQADDLELYHQHLKKLGLKTNTRRRKLMTLRRFLSYLAGRKKLSQDLGKTLPTPYKIERIPLVHPAAELLSAVQALSSETEFEQRNRILIRTLLETGCLISEAAKVRWDDWRTGKENQFFLEFAGKSPRRVPISPELYEWVQSLKKRRTGDSPWVFRGFNKFGAVGQAISPRGIELLVKAYAPKLGFGEIVPRTLRHSAVVGWFRQGMGEQEIRERLGLKSDYAFRAYAALKDTPSQSR
jgi:site-specific recombinase XerD